MRRLPVYFLIDVSESMVGDPISHVETGVETIIKTLRQDPQAIETVWVSISVFAGKAKTIMPLQEIMNFYPPKFPIGSGTSLSAGLNHMMGELDTNIIKTTAEQKGDWKPIIFLITDGVPTDDATKAIADWNARWKRGSNLVAITIGEASDAKLLGQLTEDVIKVEDANANSLVEFFRWITASIKSSSQSVESNSSGFELADLGSDALSKIDLSKDTFYDRKVDDNYIVLAGKCQQTKKPYLIKYKRQGGGVEIAGMDFNTGNYKLEGGFQVTDDYFELSDGLGTGLQVNTNMLEGAPSCPCCGNQFSFAACACGGIHCIGRQPSATCPWCNNTAEYGMSGAGGFNVERSQG